MSTRTQGRPRAGLAIIVWAALFASFPAAADKIDDLARTLMQDPSYKVRVQAALVLGKLGDRRATPALIQALKDENESVRGVAATSLGKLGDRSAAAALRDATKDSSEFVRSQAQHVLDQFASAGGERLPGPRAGARYYIAIGFETKGGNAQYAQVVRETLAKELQKLPTVTLSVGGGAPSAQARWPASA